jgi:hypothetical protein
VTETADKPRIPYGEIRWYEAFTKIKALGPHAKVTAHGIQYIVNWVNDDPAWIQLRYRENGKMKFRMVRRGDVLMLELTGAAAGPCKGGLRDESPRAAPDPISHD